MCCKNCETVLVQIKKIAHHCNALDLYTKILGPRVVFEAILKNGAKTARQFETPYFDLFHAKNLIDVKKIEILRIYLFASAL